MHKIFLGEFPEVLRSPFTQDNKRNKERKRFTMYRRNRVNISKVRRISSMEQPSINIRSIENFQTFKKSLKRAKESIKSVSFLKEASMITFNRTDYKYFQASVYIILKMVEPQPKRPVYRDGFEK